MMGQDEDTQKLRDALKQLLEENDKEVLVGLVDNLDISLSNYSNDHAIKVYAPKLLAKEGSSSSPISTGSGGG